MVSREFPSKLARFGNRRRQVSRRRDRWFFFNTTALRCGGLFLSLPKKQNGHQSAPRLLGGNSKARRISEVALKEYQVGSKWKRVEYRLRGSAPLGRAKSRVCRPGEVPRARARSSIDEKRRGARGSGADSNFLVGAEYGRAFGNLPDESKPRPADATRAAR